VQYQVVDYLSPRPPAYPESEYPEMRTGNMGIYAFLDI